MGLIGQHNFRRAAAGGVAEVVSVPPMSAFDFAVGETATARLTFLNTGIATATNDSNQSWVEPNPPANAGDYEIRAILSIGDTPSGPLLNTWHSLSTSRQWTLSAAAGQSFACTLSISIRKGSTILSTNSCDIAAESL